MIALSKYSSAAVARVANWAERIRTLCCKAVCRTIGCKWGFWLPVDWSGLDLSRGVVHAALRQCLRCRKLERGPEQMQHESRTVK